ncbi:MAG: hypothetical protein BMS9Abin14_219 [Gammaproteobacteria bacterium]|nr:MAG: hypothetical protein BMS9Abin14_219 [Gammaproteobacteria bacterium]
MAHWMKKLARHYDKIRERYPDDELLILFDIDGTILDMRYMTLHMLKEFDEVHDSSLFQRLEISDINVHEDQVDRLLDRLNLPRGQREKVQHWYQQTRWSSNAILNAHRPFGGVMEAIRWFQLQPRMSVGLNTGRPEEIREETLRSLNMLGKEYRVVFADELLFMNLAGWRQNVPNSKVAGLRHFQQAGYRVFAVIDNEPENLSALAEADVDSRVLLLHAETIFETDRSKLPGNAVAGTKYDITELITEKRLPHKVQLVWHGLNDESNVRQFLASNVEWAEFDVRMDRAGKVIVRHDSFEEEVLGEEEEFLSLHDILESFQKFDKCIKVDLKEGGELIDRTAELIRGMPYTADKLWFNAHVEVLGEAGFRRLAAAFPDTICQCRIDFLVPLIQILPEEGKRVLDRLCDWGINRFSVPWGGLPNLSELVEQMDRWGLDVNIYNVPDLEAFLKAVLLHPRSVTSDFNFPKWHYYGRGSGKDARRHEYEEQT